MICANVPSFLPLTCSSAALPPQCYRLRPSSDTAIKCADDPFELCSVVSGHVHNETCPIRLSMYLESLALPSLSQSNVIDELKRSSDPCTHRRRPSHGEPWPHCSTQACRAAPSLVMNSRWSMRVLSTTQCVFLTGDNATMHSDWTRCGARAKALRENNVP